jgi:serralysin
LNVENLNGSNFNDVLIGKEAANRLNGRTDLDALIGGLGNDSYYIDNISDVVTESSVLLTEVDTVYSSISYTLGANLENLTLIGAVVIDGTGNALTTL